MKRLMHLIEHILQSRSPGRIGCKYYLADVMTTGKHTGSPVCKLSGKRQLPQMIAVVKAVSSDPHNAPRQFQLLQLFSAKRRDLRLPQPLIALVRRQYLILLRHEHRPAKLKPPCYQLLFEQLLVHMCRKRIRRQLCDR